MDIRKIVKPNILSLAPYHAEEIPCKVKLDANESPYSGIWDKGYGVWGKKNLQTLNRYPDPDAKALREIVAGRLKIKPENILHGNGSDELIYNLITTFGGPVLYPVPTFSMYGIISQALNEKKIEIPLDAKFDLDTEKMLGAIKRYKPKLIFLSSPNNPTGNCFSTNRIMKIMDFASSLPTSHFSLVVVDEAYQPFSSKDSFINHISRYKNLIVLRTLSKIGLAGLRVGFMIADASVINEANKVRLPFNLNSLSQSLATEKLKAGKEIRSSIRSIVSERKKVYNELKKISGIQPFPTDANFILFKVRDADKMHKALLERGILVRNMNRAVKGCLRVTVGTPKENNIFLKNLREILYKS